MGNLLLIVLSALPVLLIGFYIYQKDGEKEPISLLVKLFVGGISSCFLVVFFTNFLSVYMPFIYEDIDYNTVFELFLHAFIGIGFIEEFSKWIMTYVFGYRSRYFDETYDMIIYAVFVSLGFALFENIIYVFDKGVTIGIIRALISVPAHTCNAVFMGYLLSKARVCFIGDDDIGRQKYIILSVVIPTVFHGLYDYCLFIKNDIFIFLFFVFVIILFICTIDRINKQVKNNRELR